jgi:putative membrane protein
MQGFLPFSRAGFMMDFVTIAMIVIVPLVYWGVYEVRVNKNYVLHKKILVATGAILLVAVTAFEIDVRINGWRHLAEPSPYYDTLLFPVLFVHLFFAISTTALWLVTIIRALKNIPSPPRPCEYTVRHKATSKWAARFIYCTSVTGWLFYYLAFVA